MITLYDFQEKAVQDFFDIIGDRPSLKTFRKKILLVSATGSGKTVIASSILSRLKKTYKVLIIVHKNTLVSQTAYQLSRYNIDCGFIKAGYALEHGKTVYIASIQTLANRREWLDYGWDLVVHDEAHETSFSKIGTELLYRPCCHLGLTATPYRLGKKSLQMGDIYDCLISTPVPSELQRMGLLSPMEYWGFSEDARPDLSSVRTYKSEYNSADLSRVCNKPDLIENMVNEYKRLAFGKPGLGFCTGVEHAKNAAEIFTSLGVPSAFVTGYDRDEVRLKLYRNLADKRILVLFSCHVLSIGFDLPLVEVGLDMQPTKSKARHFQKIGRLMRLSPETGKTKGIWLDQAGTCSGKLGVPEMITGYKLLHKSESEPEPAPMKQCPDCGLYNYAFTKVCQCGHEFKSDKLEITGKLVQLQVEKVSKEHKHFRTLMRKAFRMGYMPEWCVIKFFEKYSFYPKDSWYYRAVFEDTDPLNEMAYRMHLSALKDRKGKDHKWVEMWFDREFKKELGLTL